MKLKNIANQATAQRHAVLYARVSSSDQEKEGFSIPAQQRLLREYASMNGIVVSQEFVDVETAKASGRTGFNQMLAYLKKHQRRTSTILVEKTDRLYRNIKDWATLDEHGVSIHFVKENVVIGPDSRSSDQFVHGIKVLMARNYSLNLGEETIKGMTEKARAGIWPSFAPCGYRNVIGPDDKRIIVPDEREAATITEIFSLFATGNYSLKGLSEHCKDNRLFLRGKRPYVSVLQHILRKRLYTGEFEWNGTLYQGTHEPLTTLDTWTRVQQILDGRKDHQVKSVRRDFPFAGLVSCGHCGCSMVAEMKKQRYVYYHCTGFRGKCPEPYTRQEILVSQFANVLSELVIPEEILSWLADAVNATDQTEAKARENAIKSRAAELQRLSQKLETLYEDRLDGRITKSFYDEKATTIEFQRAEIAKKLDEIENQALPPLSTAVDIARLTSQACSKFREQCEAEQRKLLTMLLKKAAWKDGRLQTVLLEPFELLRLSNRANLNHSKGLEETRNEFEKWLPDMDSNHD